MRYLIDGHLWRAASSQPYYWFHFQGEYDTIIKRMLETGFSSSSLSNTGETIFLKLQSDDHSQPTKQSSIHHELSHLKMELAWKTTRSWSTKDSSLVSEASFIFLTEPPYAPTTYRIPGRGSHMTLVTAAARTCWSDTTDGSAWARTQPLVH